MKIIFLGSSHGVPEPNRRCACTMLEISGRYYFVDMGCFAVEDMVTRGIPMDAIQAVFVTHPHGDHTDGLIPFVDLLTWYYRKADPEIYLTKMEQADAIRTWVQVAELEPVRTVFREVKAGTIFDDGFLKVTAIATKHSEKSFAYLMEAEGKTFLFTGDLAHPDKDFPEIVKGKCVDLVVCEGAHFPATDYLPHFKQCNIKKIMVHHYVPWHIPSILKLDQELEKIPVTIVNDGMEVTI